MKLRHQNPESTPCALITWKNQVQYKKGKVWTLIWNMLTSYIDAALSQQGLKKKLQEMSDDDIKELLSIFLKEYEKVYFVSVILLLQEGQLKDVLLSFLYKEKSFPVFFLNSLTDEDFLKFKPMH